MHLNYIVIHLYIYMWMLTCINTLHFPDQRIFSALAEVSTSLMLSSVKHWVCVLLMCVAIWDHWIVSLSRAMYPLNRMCCGREWRQLELWRRGSASEASSSSMFLLCIFDLYLTCLHQFIEIMVMWIHVQCCDAGWSHVDLVLFWFLDHWFVITPW